MAGAQGKVRLGIVGLGGMGSNHLRDAGTIPGVRVTAACDTDPSKTAAAGGINSVMMANAVILSALRGTPVDLPLRGRELAALLAERVEGGARR